MALNSSGPISLAGTTVGQSIALELGQSATGQISLNDAAVRALAGVPSGVITMPTDFYGKSVATFLNVSFTGSPTVTTDGNYQVARYNGSGSFIVNSVGSGSVESNTIQYFVVGGGGVGGTGNGGGGGAGGVKRNTTNDYVVTAQTYGVSVGGGSSVSFITASGTPIINVGPGGIGGISGANGGAAGGPGGGGGGGALSTEYALPTSGGAAATSQGFGGPPIQAFAGGTGNIAQGANDGDIGGGGGGGGNTSIGGAGANGAGGGGGGGITTTITGSSLTFAGGGGGAGYSSDTGVAPSIGSGSAGGGNGGTNPNVLLPQEFPTSGAANSGSGGGGAGGGTGSAGSGGSGVIIIRWRFQ